MLRSLGYTDIERTERVLNCQLRTFFFLLVGDSCLEQWLDTPIKKVVISNGMISIPLKFRFDSIFMQIKG